MRGVLSLWKVNFPGSPLYDWVGFPEPWQAQDQVFIAEVEEVEPLLFLLFADLYGEFGLKAYHPFLIGRSICIVCVDGSRESFFGPVISGDKVVVDETTSSSGVD